jgi:hypothetical protein
MDKGECFVIAPIGEDGSSTRKRTDTVFKHIIQRAVEGQYEAMIAHKLEEAGMITMQIIEKIVNASLMVADLTDNNANVYYELALRHALNLPAILLIEEKQKDEIPFDLKDMRFITYDLTDLDKIDKTTEELSNQIEATEKNVTGEKNIISEEVVLMLEPKGPMDQKILLGVLLIANKFRYEVIEPYFEGLVDISERNRDLKSALNRAMRESSQKQYLKRNQVLWAFKNKDSKSTVERLYNEVETIILELGAAILRNEENEIKKHLSKWRINNTEFLQTWCRQYEESVSELSSNHT